MAFPSSPVVGGRVTLVNGVTYQWDGNYWLIVVVEKMNLVPTAIVGHVAVFNSWGQVVDGGTLIPIAGHFNWDDGTARWDDGTTRWS